MSSNRLKSWIAGWAGVLILASAARAQQTPQNYDNNYAYGNAPYSNADTSSHSPWQPFAPVGFLQKIQPFAPVDISDYGDGIKPRRGFFFSYDRLEWTISRPRITDVGNPNMDGYFLEPSGTSPNPVTTPVPSQAGVTTLGGTTYESNSLNTSQLGSKFGPGNRFDFGYWDTNDTGWLFSIIDHVSQNQTYADTGGTVLFADPTGYLQGYISSPSASVGGGGGGGTTTGTTDADLNGNGTFGRDGNGTTNALPDTGDERTFIPRFQYLSYSLHTEMNGIEIMRQYRLPKVKIGGELDFMYGVRYLQFYDRFGVFGGENANGTENGFGQVNPPMYSTTSSTTTTSSSQIPIPNYVTAPGINIFDNFVLTQKVRNNLIGPQVGMRYAHQRGRWKTSAEGRLFLAANFQNTTQYGTLGSLFVNPNVGIGQPFSTTSASSGTGSGSSTTTNQTQTIPPAQSALEIRDAPANMHPLSWAHSLTQQYFTPGGELRLNCSYEVTRACALRFGYTGVVLGNIARAPNSIDYTLINMGILPNNHQTVFVNGVNFGVEFNR